MPSVIGQGSGTSGFDPGLQEPPLTFGVWGDNGTGTGVLGSSSQPEVASADHPSGGAGVHGVNDAPGGVGVVGQANGSGAVGVLGVAAFGAGVRGRSRGAGAGVEGTSPQGTGVLGHSDSTGTGVSGQSAEGLGVVGRSGSGGGFGFGFAPNQAPGVLGASNEAPGVLGISGRGAGVSATSFFGVGLTASGLTLAADFTGNVRVSGVLIQGGGGVAIDHPLHPASGYLAHASVASPERKTVYDGVARLDADGRATVELPAWFEALNESYRYQLTSLGAPAPDLHVGRTVADRSFSIAGGVPGGEVSWQVTGVRRDAWAKAHPVVVEEDKPPEERGRFLHPEENGEPAERGLSVPVSADVTLAGDTSAAHQRGEDHR